MMKAHSTGVATFGCASNNVLSKVVPDLGRPRMKKTGMDSTCWLMVGIGIGWMDYEKYSDLG